MSLLSTLLTNAKAVSLTDDDLRRICFNRVRIVIYNELEGVNDIFELFDPYNAFILFYSTTSDFVGHWVAVVFHQAENTIYFYDSYALNDVKLVALARDTYADTQGRAILSEMIRDAKDKWNTQVKWNTKRMQSTNVDDVSTCGRYAALRVRFADLSNDQFNSILTDKRMSSDNLVSLLTVAFSEDMDDMVRKQFHKK
jgi:hypothetical protein